MARTKQQGYYHLKSKDQWLHFSMNCWVVLKEECGLDITSFAEFNKTDCVLTKLSMISDLIYCSAKAYSLENEDKLDFNRYSVRNWLEELSEDEVAGVMECMSSTLISNSEGK